MTLPSTLDTIQPPIGIARWLDESDFTSVMDLRSKVLEELSTSGHMLPEDDDAAFVLSGLKARGQTIGIFQEDSLIATSSVDYTNPSKHGSLWAHRGLVRSWVRNANVACLQSTIVRTDMRGYGIQRYMIDSRIMTATTYGCEKVWAAVAFLNYRSLQNLLSSGFRIVDLVEFEGQSFGKISRFGLEWSKNGTETGNRPSDISLLDLEAQAEALRKGFLGVSIYREGDVPVVRYSLPSDRDNG